MATSTPAAPESRLVALDALRGLALLGVLLSNLDGWFRVNPYAAPVNATTADFVADTALWLVVEHKAFILFSFLFGVGLALQAVRLGRERQIVLLRRLFVVLGFGLIHLLLSWNGDILVEYAVAGLIVLPLVFARAGSLALGGFVAMTLFLIIAALGGDFLKPGVDAAQAHAAYVSGGYGERLAFSLRELDFIGRLHLFILPRTVGLMLLGAAAWKAGVFRARAASLRIGALVLLPAGLVLTAFGWDGAWMAELAPLLLAAGYAALVFGFAPAVERRLGFAAAVGRMAFTNYLTQSVVLGLIFFGHGLALQGRLGAAAGLTIGACLWLAQAAFSVWWLKSHAFGPLEWAWRSLTYGRAQAWRRA
jgi:uncharacterized protein